jgi:hypothetical protein
MSEHRPTTWCGLFRIDRNDDTLNTKGLSRFRNQFRFADCRRIYADFVRSSQKHFPDICRSANATADRERHKTFLGRSFHHIYHRTPVVRGSRDIKKHKFIGALPVIFDCAFDRIPRIA